MRQYSQIEQENIGVFKPVFYEVWNERRPEAIYQSLASHFVCHFEHQNIAGPDSFKKEYYDPVVRAFPDLRVGIQEAIASDDCVIGRWWAIGTQQGELFGVPPSGRQVTGSGIDWSRFVDGRAAETWDSTNLSYVLKQIQARIRTLRGILPLCSHCKSIRNDKGDWEQLERYISNNTEASVSHGICPKCLAREFPEVAERLKKEKKS